MARLFCVLAALALLTGLFAPLGASPASACFVNLDPATDYDLVVAGRFSTWEIATDLMREPVYSPEVPIRVFMEVDLVVGGNLPRDIEILDMFSLRISDDGPGEDWVWSSVSCGAFDDDPTGDYGVLALTRMPDGTLQANYGVWLYLGAEPEGDEYAQALNRLADRGPDFPYLPAAAIALLIPALLLGAAAFLPRRT